ncbi:type I-E CRISPR-associated protein Cse1/CasA [Chrysiogenes arsenatis]|uniref:type I-E CRISPR-associated protein Cse1/CasA n=1 Tax=Chrysiogenes arsenatis TaxID=309797 RepID=UPI0003FDF737|nr:type I-E CRISPR-associated protein Cse1/CasA [Chrysiogenes arsenatis]
MNVAFDPWIPVINHCGERNFASIHDVFAEGEQYADFAVRPHERVALMRLLLCVAHAALNGPKDLDEWEQVPHQIAAATGAYLKQWQDFFDLFHPEKPWLQIANISRFPDQSTPTDDLTGWTSVSKLNFTCATGNNSTLNDHGGMCETRVFPIESTILSMITFLCFSTGGLSSQIYWDGKQTAKTARDAPCVPASMIHAFLRGKTLFETVYLNLITHDDIGKCYGHKVGRPVWESMPDSWDNQLSIDNATKSFSGRLMPLSRFLLLHPGGNHLLFGEGLAYPNYAEGFSAEPSAAEIVKMKNKKEERALLSFRPSRQLWRELGALMVKRKAGEAGGPLTLLNLSAEDECDVTVSALARNQATVVDTVESVFHVPGRLSTAVGVSTYEKEVKSAEQLASRLGWAVETYRMEHDGGWEGRLKNAGASSGELRSKLYSKATTHYWTAIEKNLGYLMEHVQSIGGDHVDETREKWRKMLFYSACDAYRTACGQETPRQIRAFAKGWQKLTGQKASAQTVNQEEEGVSDE